CARRSRDRARATCDRRHGGTTRPARRRRSWAGGRSRTRAPGRSRSRAAARRRGGRGAGPSAPAGSCRASASACLAPPEPDGSGGHGPADTLPGVTEVRAPGAAPLAFAGSFGGATWEVSLDRSILLPGRLVGGRIAIRAEREIDARGVVVALIAEEHWRHTETRHGPNNTTTSEVVTSRAELLREPVLVHGALHLGAGETWTGTFEQPVPAMGPATLEAQDAGLEWTFEAKLDMPGRLDSG